MKGLTLAILIILSVAIVGGVIYSYYHTAGTTSTNTGTTSATAKQIRIVSLAPSDTQVLISLGLGKDIVGLDPYSYQLLKDLNMTSYLPSNITIIQTYPEIDIEEIVKLEPTVVVLEWGLYASYIPKMQSLGLNLLITNSDYAYGITQIEYNIMQIASYFNLTSEGEELIEWMQSHLHEYVGEVRIAYLDWICPNGDFYTAGGNVFINDIIVTAGGINVFGNLANYPLLSPSNLLVSNASVLIVQEMYNYTYTMNLVKQYYSNVPAVQEGNVYVLSGLAVDLIDEPSVLSVYAVNLFHDIATGKAPHYIDSSWVLENLNVSLPVF
jgi:iron complex transport system substrate-binding protein